MKKHRILAIVMAVLVMAALITVPAMAADDGYITIKAPEDLLNPYAWTLEGRRFDAYKIFDVTIVGGGEFAYVLDTHFTTFQTAYGKGDLATYVAGLTTPEEINGFAADVWEYIVSTPVPSEGFVVGEEDDTTVVIEDLPYGYYLVYGSAIHVGDTPPIVAACALTTTDPGATVNLKLDAPSIAKHVWDVDMEDADEPIFMDDPGWVTWCDIDIYEGAAFKLTFTVPDMTGYDKYWITVHDQLSGSFSTPDALHFYKDGVEWHLTTGVDYNSIVSVGTPKYDEDENYAGCFILEITFDPELFLDLAGSEINILYFCSTAGLRLSQPQTAYDSEAEAYYDYNDIRNPNLVYLEYSSNPYMTGEGTLSDSEDKGDTSETPPKEVDVYSYFFKIFKYAGSSLPLPGAKFMLLTDKEDPETAINFKIDLTGDETWPSYYSVVGDWNTGAGYTTEMLTPESGRIQISGIDAGTYWLVETEAPDGYNELEDPIKVEIISIVDGLFYVFADDSFVSQQTVNVQNSAGQKFPGTGGIGRVIFIVVGIALMGGAIVAYVARKRIVNLIANR